MISHVFIEPNHQVEKVSNVQTGSEIKEMRLEVWFGSTLPYKEFYSQAAINRELFVFNISLYIITIRWKTPRISSSVSVKVLHIQKRNNKTETLHHGDIRFFMERKFCVSDCIICVCVC